MWLREISPSWLFVSTKKNYTSLTDFACYQKYRENSRRLTCLSSFCWRRLVPSSSKELQHKESKEGEEAAVKCASVYSVYNIILMFLMQLVLIWVLLWNWNKTIILVSGCISVFLPGKCFATRVVAAVKICFCIRTFWELDYPHYPVITSEPWKYIR